MCFSNNSEMLSNENKYFYGKENKNKCFTRKNVKVDTFIDGKEIRYFSVNIIFML